MAKVKSPEEMLLDYEIEVVCSLIIQAYNARPNPSFISWFSLKQVFDHYASYTDASNLCACTGKRKSDACKRAATNLREAGLHIGARAFIGGEVQRPVWASQEEEMAFFRQRLTVPAGARGRGDRTEFDAKHQWRPE